MWVSQPATLKMPQGMPPSAAARHVYVRGKLPPEGTEGTFSLSSHEARKGWSRWQVWIKGVATKTGC